MTIIDNSIIEATQVLKRGGLIAYPTEAVYGLGCDPFNQRAVEHLLFVKKRSLTKAFILITNDWRYVEELVQPIEEKRFTQVLATWPGPATWVFPASDKVPYWLLGLQNTLALRITNHPLARHLCQVFQNPIVSTSANIADHDPARDSATVLEYFQDKIDYILEGEVGSLKNPTPIRDAITGKILRA